VVVVGAPVGAVVRDVDATEVGDFHAPEDLTIVGVERHKSVEALMEKSAVGGEGGGHAGLAIDAEVGTGATDPLEFEITGGLGASKTFAGVGGVGGWPVLVGPFAGARNGIPGGEGAIGKGGATVRAGEADELGRRAGKFFTL